MDLSDHPNVVVRCLAGVFPDHCAFPVGRMLSFPGLGQTDTAVLSECLRLDTERPEAWWIEAPVGDLPEWALGLDVPTWWKDYVWQYQLRADLVHVRGDQVYVTEIKGECRASGVGQVLVYVHALQAQLGSGFAVQPSILCRHAGAEVRRFCSAVGVHLHCLDGA